jgi:hypothetical protein
MTNPPIPISRNIRIGSHVGLSRSSFGTGGVYRDDAATPDPEPDVADPVDPDDEDAAARGASPGLVPFGVTRPVVFLLGGATGGESTLPGWQPLTSRCPRTRFRGCS